MIVSMCGVKIRIIFLLTHSYACGKWHGDNKKKIGFANDGDKSYFKQKIL